jgi:hypothetical protein
VLGDPGPESIINMTLIRKEQLAIMYVQLVCTC